MDHPIQEAKKLIVFETISGLLYVFVAESRVPPPLELLGILVLIGGVLIGIHRMRSADAPASGCVVEQGRRDASAARGVRWLLRRCKPR